MAAQQQSPAPGITQRAPGASSAKIDTIAINRVAARVMFKSELTEGHCNRFQ
jgi:hypothetical protein